MKKPVTESRIFSRVNANLLVYILSKVDSKKMEETLAHVEIDNEIMSDVDEVEGDDESDTSDD